jgi:hypothetical protein
MSQADVEEQITRLLHRLADYAEVTPSAQGSSIADLVPAQHRSGRATWIVAVAAAFVLIAGAAGVVVRLSAKTTSRVSATSGRGASAAGKNQRLPQTPLAGGPTSRPTRANMPSAATPACDPSKLRLFMQAQGENTGTVVGAVVTASEGAPCRLATTATLSLLDVSGHLLAVNGNPATATISGLVGETQQDSQFTNSFYWSNWCGPRSPSPQLRLRLPAIGLETTEAPPHLPVCVDTTSASVLATIPS